MKLLPKISAPLKILYSSYKGILKDKKGFIKLTRKTLVSIFAFWIVIVGSGLLYLFGPWTTGTQAVWYDDNWSYRQKVTATNNTTAQTSYQLAIYLDTATLISAGKMQSDCDDIRVTTVNGALMPIWTEYCSSSAANGNSIIWVRGDTVIAGTSEFFIYYGNPSAASGSVYTGNPSGVSLGTGKDGAITVSTDKNINTDDMISGRTCSDTTGGDAVIYSVTSSVAAGATTVTLSSTPTSGCLVAGDEIIIINLQGTPTDNSNVGKYETARINSIATATLTLNHALTNAYDGTTQKIAVQRIPNYTSVTLSNASTDLTSSAFDGTYGGILMFRANGTVTVAASTTINVNGKGYRGGAGGASGANGGVGGESYDGNGSTNAGKGGSGSSNDQTKGGGKAAEGSSTSPNNGATRGGGGGGGSDGSSNTNGSAGGGAGGGYAGGGGGGGGGADNGPSGGNGGTGGSTGTAAGGGGGSCGGPQTAAGNGGNAGSAGGTGTCTGTSGAGGEVGSGSTQGSGGAGTANVNNGGAGGGGGGIYGAAALSTLFFGSGGGGGGATTLGNGGAGGAGDSGYAGGGIVLIHASTISNSGNITSTGTDSATATNTGGGAGGAGAGGSVLLYGSTLTLGSSTVTANGGAASNGATQKAGAGAGGVGRIAINYSSTTGTTSPSANTTVHPVTGAAASEEKAPSPTLYWKFNDTTVGTAEDNTSNGLDGTHNNTPTIQTEDQCISGKCLYFDGSNNENVSKADDGKLDFVAADNFTVQAWVKRNGASSANNFILTKAQAGYTGYKLYQDASGDYCFDVSDGTNTDTACTSAVDFDDDKWHFVTGVKNGTTSITLYVDGVQRAQDATIAATGTLANTGTFYVGVDLDGISNEWLGFIDEVKVYRDNTARSAAQIQADYNARATGEGASAVLGQASNNNPGALSNGLVGYWKMDESSGNAVDSSGNSVTLTNNNTTTYAVGKFGNASSYNGSNQYFSTATTISGIKAVSFWVNPASNSNNYVHLTSSAYITSSSGTVSATGFTSPTVYVNGVANGTITASTWNLVTITTDTGINANAFEVGRANGSYLSNTSKMDEVRTYNRALSPAEVSQLYNFAPGPVGYWKMDEGSWDGTSGEVKDASGNGLNGTSTNAKVVNGKYGNAGNFDGTGDYVEVADNNLLDITGNITLSAWIYPTTISTYNLVIAKHDSTADTGYNLFYSSTTLLFQAGDGGGGWPYINTSASYTFSTNTWYHISATRNGTTVELFVNGVKIGTTTVGANAISANTKNVWLARDVNTGTDQYAVIGRIDDAKIYNYARTQKQIVQDMNAGHPAVGSPIGSAVGHWKFDEGVDNICSGGTNDACNSGSGGSTLDGAGSGFASPATAASGWSQSGKFSKALQFDGTDDVVTITNANAIDMDTSLANHTLSAWVYADSDGEGDTGQIYQKGTSTYLRVDSQSGSNLDVEANIDLATTDANVNVSIGITTGSWNHILTTWDGTTLRVYINGVLKGSGTGSGAISADANNLLIGGTTTANFDGTIDDVKVYNYALTADEVKVDMNRGSSQVLGTVSDNSSYQKQAANQEYCIPGDSTSCAAPVGRWDFEEGSGTTVFDTSTNGKSGTWSGSSTHYASGKIGKAGNFNGYTGTDYVNINSFTTLNSIGTGDFTISGWFKIRSADATTYTYIFNAGTSDNSSSIDLRLGNSAGSDFKKLMLRTRASSANSDTDSTTTNLADGTWHQVTAVRRSSGTIQEIYIDGKLDVSQTVTARNVSVVTGARTAIGTFVGSSTDYYFVGQLDQVRVFNYARSSAQIAWDYNKGAPALHWKMDECQGTSINDSSGNGNTGTLTLGATGQTTAGTCSGSDGTPWKDGVSGKINYSLDLDGISDYIHDGSTPLIDGGAQATYTAWIYPTADPSDGNYFTILVGGDATQPNWNPQQCRILYYNVSGNGTDTKFYFDCGVDNANSVNSRYTSNTYTTLNTWYHIVATFSSGTINMYVNGVLDNGTAAGSGTNINTSADNTVSVGAVVRTGETLTNLFHTGKIDDARIYNYALTATQVKELYNGGVVNFKPTTGAP